MSDPNALSAQLQQYRQGFLDHKATARLLVDNVPDEELTTPPAPGAWSAVQCLDHLNTVGWLLLERMEPVLQDAMQNGPRGTPPFRYGVVSRWFVRLMDPNDSFSIPAPSSYAPDPTNTLRPNETVHAFLSLQDAFADCIVQAEGVDLRAVRVGSPAMPLLRISAGAWMEATILHEARHLQQAQAAIDAAAKSTAS